MELNNFSNNKKMRSLPCLILAGGFGSRLSSLTNDIPKPLVKIGRNPIIIEIIRIYLKQGIRNFYIATGYKWEKFIEFFRLKKEKGKKHYFKKYILDNKTCNINIIFTGKNTFTGGRIKEAAKYFQDDIFFLTYGDGLANVNLNKLFMLHKKFGRLVTVTAVNPPPRFGEIQFNNSFVKDFSEKKELKMHGLMVAFL